MFVLSHACIDERATPQRLARASRECVVSRQCSRLLEPGASRSAPVHGLYNLGMVASKENLELGVGGRCELCDRRVGEDRLTRHHLLPRSRARKMKRRSKSRQELKWRNPGRTIALCNPCHRNVHVTISNADLGRGYDSVEALRNHPGVRRFTEWVKDKPHERT
jgi:hypothetical protein